MTLDLLIQRLGEVRDEGDKRGVNLGALEVVGRFKRSPRKTEWRKISYACSSRTEIGGVDYVEIDLSANRLEDE